MRLCMRLALLFICAVPFGSPPAHAELSVELLSGNIPAERLDTLIEEHANDPTVVFDLLGLKSAILTEASQFQTAAELVEIQAALAIRHADQIDADVPALHRDAADLYLKADDPAAALVQLYLALDGLRDGAANVTTIQALLAQIAALEESRGQYDIAAELRAASRDVQPPSDKPIGTRSTDQGFARVDVFYATDRKPTGATRPERFFDSARASGLNYGIAEVTIPRTHVPGTIEAPSVWKLEFSPNPTKHVMLQSVTPVQKDDFFGAMQKGLLERGAQDAFVFVHGFNVPFDAAAKRTAQLAHDMNFRGLPVLYSWPSRGATIGYVPDTAVVRLSGRRLTYFLEDLVEKSGATTIHLIAHSMGNRAMTDALELMALRHAPLDAPIFEQVIFAAPDVDQGLFAEMLPTIRPIAKRLTLYASDQDWALEASRKLHGNQPRAGQGGDVALMNDQIDTVDMSALGKDMLAHSYVANEQSAILDIVMLFWRNVDPRNRCGLTAKESAERVKIWQYQKALCSDQNLLPLVAILRDAGAVSKAQVRDALRTNFASDAQVRALEETLLEFVPD